MSWSLGEIRSLSIKAARGAGMSWGLAEEAGFSVSWLEERGWPGVQALAGYLDSLSGYNGNSCPISTGANLSDLNQWQDIFPAKLHQPLLAVPFLSLITEDCPLALNWSDQSVTVDPEGNSGEPDTKAVCTGIYDCRVTETELSSKQVDLIERVTDDRQPFVTVLEKFAHKTYAPATEESRAKGADAGLTDND